MSFKRTSAIALSTLALAAAGTAVTASPAAADGSCAAATLCLDEDKYLASIDITSKTTVKNCIKLPRFGQERFVNGIRSYANKLPVSVDVYWYDGTKYIQEGTIRPGGSSRDTTAVYKFGMSGATCTGGGNPNILLT
ncbi:hypothetical protein [Streptomyces sp. NPDC048603]|uniref:hypothetical protein n=1 Tax=Streptomyces sp. NPDC048603 TaxID=3365577 RepID=UPI003715C64C